MTAEEIEQATERTAKPGKAMKDHPIPTAEKFSKKAMIIGEPIFNLPEVLLTRGSVEFINPDTGPQLAIVGGKGTEYVVSNEHLHTSDAMDKYFRKHFKDIQS